MKHNQSNKAYLTAAAVGASLLAFAGAGCGNSSSEDPVSLTRTTVIVPTTATGHASSAERPASAAGAPISNTNAGPGGATGTEDVIAGRIDAAIIHNTQMTGSRVAAVVNSNGVATLNGTVQNAQQKALAEKAARETPGVLMLKSKLEIRPTGGSGKASQPTARVLTALPIGTDGTASAGAANNDASTANSAQPRVMVVNNYVPVPQQSDSQSDPSPTVNVLFAPNGSNIGGYAAANGSYYDGSGQYGYNGNDGSASFGNSYYDDGSSNGVSAARLYTGRPGIVRSNLVPNYLRDMSDANDYNNFIVNGGGGYGGY